jgi:hypothetical protein
VIWRQSEISSQNTASKETALMIPVLNRRRLNGRVALITALFALVAATAASPAGAATDFGIETVGASLSTLQAGAHPDVVTEVSFKKDSSGIGPAADVKDLSVELPPGLTANPQNFPQCSFTAFAKSQDFNNPPCSPETQIGLVEVRFQEIGATLEEPLYNLASSDDEVARLGFLGIFYPIVLETHLRSGGDYGVTVRSKGIESIQRILSIRATTWGVPADPTHDAERLTPSEALACSGAPGGAVSGPCYAKCPFANALFCLILGVPAVAGESRKSSLPPEPFTTNPASCGPAEFGFEATTYQHPDVVDRMRVSAGEISGCEKVPFNPSLAISTTSRRAGAPTGLEATLKLPGDEAVNTLNPSPLRSARVALPEGMTVNPSAADGLQACSVAQAAFGTEEASTCPNGSKVGTAEITSAALKRPIRGGVFLRTPEPGHLVRFWLVAHQLGVNLKLPAEVELNESTGQLTTVIHESPQLPADEVVLRLNGGARAPLRNPLSCGTFDASYELGPWSGNAPVNGVAPIVVSEGCEVGGFHPTITAGTASPTAGGFSPLVFELDRDDGEENVAAIDVSLPRGLSAKLAGVPLCPQQDAPVGACPPASQIGVALAAVGTGTQPLWVPQPGKDPTAVYLAGPYKGAPYSVVAKVPAQAGPFDLGVVTIRSGIYVDPETAQVTVKSDRLPQILQGIPIEYRQVRLEVSRKDFTLNPTSCAEQRISASVLSAAGSLADASDRFQAADCASLGFGPKLKLHLSGGTKRSAHPRLRAVLTAKRGEANIRRVSVALPHSEFLEQAHIRTVCTRVQFAADACPQGSVYGHASVTTPLLDEPLSGPVYLRSSSHELPDLVVDLQGQIRITLAGRIDSVHGGIRTTFAAAPDAPIRKFVLNMTGGKKGLLVNSTNLCVRAHRAIVKMVGQNGRNVATYPRLTDSC